MFVTASHTPQLLPRAAYSDRDQYDREIERLFLPAWHFVGSVRSLARDGDFFTVAILGRQLLIMRMDGQPRAFLNVCAHRYSPLTDLRCGHAATLRCQYHGWEYDAAGCTRKIPDAPNFRPLDRDTASLTNYRIAACGQLLFVSLAEDGPTLEEHLGSFFAVLEQLFPVSSRNVTSQLVGDANWKVIVENNVESYHIDSVHPKTLHHFPNEDECHHRLFDHATLFEGPGMPPSLARRAWDFVNAKLDQDEPTRRYHHLLVYPNLVVFWNDSVGGLQAFDPVSPTKTYVRMMAFIRQGPPSKALWNLLIYGLSLLELRFWQKVVLEDFRLYASLQRGLDSPDAPVGGLLSRREERCTHFQAYVARETGLPLPEPVMMPVAAGEPAAVE